MSDEQAPYRSACNVCGRQWIDGKEVASGLLESQTIDQLREALIAAFAHVAGQSEASIEIEVGSAVDALIAAVRHSGEPT